MKTDLHLNASLCYKCSYWDWVMVVNKHGQERPEHSCCNDDPTMKPGDMVVKCLGFDLNQNRGND
jgi:hypothetical protein